MLRIRKFGTRRLDLELALGRGNTCRILLRPGTWMTDAALEALVAELRAVAAEAVRGGSLDYGVLTGSRESLSRAVITVLYAAPGRRPVAFSAMQLLPVRLGGRDHEVVHLGLALVSPSVRGQGNTRALYGFATLLLFLLRGGRPYWVTNVSQVPSAIGSFAVYFDQSFPSLGPDCRREEHFAIAEQLMARHRAAFGVGADAEFDALGFVIRNAYTGGSGNLQKPLDAATRHRRSTVARMCFAALDYARGDDFLQVGRYSARVWLRVAWRRLRRRALIRAALARRRPDRSGLVRGEVTA